MAIVDGNTQSNEQLEIYRRNKLDYNSKLLFSVVGSFSNAMLMVAV